MRERKPSCEEHSTLLTTTAAAGCHNKNNNNEEGKQLLLKDEGVEAVRSLCESREGSNQWHVLEALREIGLLSLLRAAWKWQEPELCLEFVRNWNHQTKATRVGDVEINVSLEKFALATGLRAEGTGLLSRPMDHENLVKHFESAPAVKPQNGYMLHKCRDPVLRDIVILLNMTLWMKLIRQSRCSGELLYLVVEAMEGQEVNWNRVFYEKFVCEVMRLQYVLSNKHMVSHQQLITVAGPLMCFLYDCAKVNIKNISEAAAATAAADDDDDRSRGDLVEISSSALQNAGDDDYGGAGGVDGDHNSIDDRDSGCTKRSFQDCMLDEDSVSGRSSAAEAAAEMPTKVQKVDSTRAYVSSMELVDVSEQR